MSATRAIAWILTCTAAGCGGVGPGTRLADGASRPAREAATSTPAPELAEDPRVLAPVQVAWRKERPARWMGGGWLMDEVVTQTHDGGATLITHRGASLEGLDAASGRARWQRELDERPSFADAGEGQLVAAWWRRVVSVSAGDGSIRWEHVPRDAGVEGMHVMACQAGPCDVLLEVTLFPPPRHETPPRVMPTGGAYGLLLLSGEDGSELARSTCSACDVVEARAGSIVVRGRSRELQRLDDALQPAAGEVPLAPGRLLLTLDDGGVVLDRGALRRIGRDGGERWALPMNARLGALPARRARGARLDARRAFVVLDRVGWTPHGRAAIAKLGVWLDVERGTATAAGWLPADVFQVFAAGGRVTVGTPQWLMGIAPPAAGAEPAAARSTAEVVELALGTARGNAHVAADEAAQPGRFPYDTQAALALLDAEGGALARDAAGELLAGVRADLAGGTPELLQRAGRRLRALGRWLPEDAAEALATRIIALGPPRDTAAVYAGERGGDARALALARHQVRAQVFAAIERSVVGPDALYRLAATAGWGEPPTGSACEDLSADDVAALWALMRHLHLTQPQRHTHVPQLPCIPEGHLPPDTRLHATLEAHRRLERVQLTREPETLEALPRGDARWDTAPTRVFQVDDGKDRGRVVRAFGVRKVGGEWRVADVEERRGADSVLLLR